MVYRSSRGKSFEDRLKPEQKVQKRVIEFLRWNPSTKQVLWFHCPSEYYKKPFEKYLWEILGGRAGISDIIFLAPSKNKKFKFFLLELKCDGQLLKKRDGSHYFPKQEAVLEMARKAGGKGEFACGYDEAVKLIQAYFG